MGRFQSSNPSAAVDVWDGVIPRSVVHVGPNLLPIPPPLGGAIERRIWGLACAQHALGAEVTILASRDSQARRRGGQLPEVVPLPGRSRSAFSRQAASWIVARNPDVVHVHSRPEVGLCLRKSRYRGLVALSFDFPLMFGSLHRVFRGYRLGLGLLLERSADLFLPVSDFATSSLGHRGVRLPASRTRILWNGIDMATPVSKANQRLPHTALFVGRFVEQKGSDLFLEAAERLPDWEFFAIGPRGGFSTEGSPEQRLGRVRHLGPLSDAEVSGWMRRVTCLVLPTREWEVFGMVLVEALSNGAVVVAPDADGPAEILASAPATRLFPSGDVASLVTAIENSEADWEERVAGQRFAGRFTWPTLAEVSLLYYQAVSPKQGLR